MRRIHDKAGITLIDLLAICFPFCTAGAIGAIFNREYGIWAGIGAGVAAWIVCAYLVVLFYRWSWRLDDRRRAEVREAYRGIYRVVQIPSDAKNIRLAEFADIRIGDYGWEAEPFRKTQLLYLQGLTTQWEVVWYAGFEPGDIEYVGPKPSSQYDRTWRYGETPPPCPFPVERMKTYTLGLPYPNFFRRKKTNMGDT